MELLCEELSEQVFIVGGHQSLSRMAWVPDACRMAAVSSVDPLR